MIVNFKTMFRVETYDFRLIVHLASIVIEKQVYKLYHRFLNEFIRNLGLSMKKKLVCRFKNTDSDLLS